MNLELTLHNLNDQTVPLIATQHKGDPHPLQHIGFCPFLQYFLWLLMTIIVIFGLNAQMHSEGTPLKLF